MIMCSCRAVVTASERPDRPRPSQEAESIDASRSRLVVDTDEDAGGGIRSAILAAWPASWLGARHISVYEAERQTRVRPGKDD